MKANELRIGNMVNLCFEHKEGWFKARVTEILNDNTINTDTTESDNNHYYFEPIPLSEEILFKVGFELKGVVQAIGYFRLIYEDGGKLFFYSHPMLKIEVKYLHQLQNLYYLSRGQELNTSNLTDL